MFDEGALSLWSLYSLRTYSNIIALGYALLLSPIAFAQVHSTEVKAYQERYDRAMQYSELYLFAESAAELEKAIEYAEKHNMEPQRINAVISMGELMRKTRDFPSGIERLSDLPESVKYPALHIRKLGRLAALHIEYPAEDYQAHRIIAAAYLKEALALSQEGGYMLEEAGLLNELGMLERPNSTIQTRLPLLQESARLFLSLNDTLGAIPPLTHLMDYYHQMGAYEQADSLRRLIPLMLNGKGWYTSEVDYYNLLSYWGLIAGDSLEHYRWKTMAMRSLESYYKASNSNQMSSFRVLQETRKYQEQARESSELVQLKAAELERQTARTRELFIYVSILGVFVLGVIALLFRERSLKRKVDVANEKYHMLIVESNHRIKNNLQMIISMLEYTSKDLPETETSALRRMSGKIHTISALHKHLYLDVHNERVDLNMYFSEIITLYEEIAPDGFQVQKHIDPVDIKSERIVYFGLIFNEMLANTIEHHPSKVKTVHITVRHQGDRFRFEYRDGSTRPQNLVEGTGSLLIRQLIQRVGGQHFQFDPSSGQYQFLFQP